MNEKKYHRHLKSIRPINCVTSCETLFDFDFLWLDQIGKLSMNFDSLLNPLLRIWGKQVHNKKNHCKIKQHHWASTNLQLFAIKRWKNYMRIAKTFSTCQANHVELNSFCLFVCAKIVQQF